ncbi:DUF7638 domain-containing protein [Kibdelosporangium phytohabitans]|uniref:DUF7638 domain-containing protein n=1 Tax=Kibdelosporangium phytohabitans TaxID=860235 RepID=UPI0019DDAEDB|nr:hypothetical protein [Kibdelosporangium phytohabitans]MBE1469104.1 hypothetical protein [Kibdelosporangium phytohabitans]
MLTRRRTWREEDGMRIEGTWRHVFIRNGPHFLSDLVIYADGMVECQDLVTLAEFEDRLVSGWVNTDLPEGARASVHHLGAWTFAEPSSWLTPDMLLGEVRDTIDQLNGRPDSADRCMAVLEPSAPGRLRTTGRRCVTLTTRSPSICGRTYSATRTARTGRCECW